MTDTHDTREPSWRPLAQKLSGLIRKRSSAKSKTSLETTDERSSVFRFKRQKKAPVPDNAQGFRPLEVDLNRLEAIHLSDGWLEADTRIDELDEVEQQQPPNPEIATTPIAALFASKSVLDIPNSGEVRQSFSRTRGDYGNRPFSMVETQSITYFRESADLASTRDVQVTGSILDRGRPVEPKQFVTSPPPKKAEGLRQELPPLSSTSAMEKTAAPRYLPPRSSRDDSTGLVAVKPIVSHQLRPVEQPEPIKRHSMYAGAIPSINYVAARTKTAQAPVTPSTLPLDRIQAWQKSITSAPTPAASSVASPASALALTPAVPFPSTAPVRRVSTRGTTGNRLAWIKELEEKKSSNMNREQVVLKKQMGSVSDKLAMFESKQGPAASTALRLPPLTRSNSTTSRRSSACLESASVASGNVTATPRTSIDTVRSSHRASSVMNYYDDSFREKMESVVGGYSTDKEKSDAQKKDEVTIQITPLEPEKREAEAQPSQLDASILDESRKVEDVLQSAQTDASISNEPGKGVEVIQSAQTDASILNEQDKGEEALQSSQTDISTLNEALKGEEALRSSQTDASTLSEPGKAEVLQSSQIDINTPSRPGKGEEALQPSQPQAESENIIIAEARNEDRPPSIAI